MRLTKKIVINLFILALSFHYSCSNTPNESNDDISNNTGESCIDSSANESRYISFSCNGYTLGHVGFYGAGHGAASSVTYNGQTNASTDYFLTKLGAYNISPVTRTDLSNVVQISNLISTITLDQNVTNSSGETVTVERSFIIHLPPSYSSSKVYPVVFGFHGNGGVAASWISRIGPLQVENPFVGVYLQGYSDLEDSSTRNSWNLGLEDSTADDIEFVKAVLATDEMQFLSPEASKRFALGSSNGAGFLSLLAANTTENIIFPNLGLDVSGLIKNNTETGATSFTIPVSLNKYQYGIQESSLPVNIITIFGMADPIIPYCEGDASTGYTMYGAEENIRIWADQAGCSDAQTKSISTFSTPDSSSIDLTDLDL